jgi:hypothetical protein
MKHIRKATPIEIEAIREKSDLTGLYSVLALDNHLAVVRQVTEIDPVFFAPGANDSQKAKFLWGLEERLMGAGVKEFYFQVVASDERWRGVIEGWGGIQVSPVEEIRYKKVLEDS